ncbi:hypothetical protein SADUNF_Sadunf02G0165700 [Salix dunnii]|uniref:Uncharacterized protein n=1 Tax=Salix dunnii TaxID=1413687 RepID=A0A835N8K5_9ROSI|nr:hypothetical protein SADUNF_Sadunf02G0165700 [Salix dunnii]
MGVLKQGTIVDRIDCNIQNVVASTMEERVKQTQKVQFSLSPTCISCHDSIFTYVSTDSIFLSFKSRPGDAFVCSCDEQAKKLMALTVFGVEANGENLLDTTEIDIRLPMLVYVSHEKRSGYDHNKKVNALVRTSAIMSNSPFILNLDSDHYISNSLALREGMYFMLDRGGDRICYVKFPQRFEGIDPSDQYANHNIIFFDVSVRAFDGLQGPMHVGSGCIFGRTALYGFSPPRTTEHHGWFCRRKIILFLRKPKAAKKQEDDEITLPINGDQAILMM